MDTKPDNLLALFRSLLNVSQQMLDITQKTEEEEDFTIELTNLIEKRAELMQGIDAIEARVDTADGLNDEDKLAVKQIIKQKQETDDKVSHHLKSQMHILREKIGNVKQNKKAQTAYLGSEDQADGWFFDSRK